MSDKITRRTFLKTSAAIGVGSVLGKTLAPDVIFGGESIDVAVVTGDDYLANAKKAVELLGGIERFVPKNAKVALLPNPQSSNPGTHTKPAILRAAIQMCKAAGAGEIACLSWLPEKYWSNTGLKQVVDSENVKLLLTNMKDETRFTPVPIPKGVVLKEAHVMKTFFDYDLLINIPITKEHSGNNFTCSMKNLMALTAPATNQIFHKKDWKTNIDSIRHLEQCIADLNTIINPALFIVDSTEFVITNGPFGPGELLKPRKVVAGTDRVAVDAYCATLFGYAPGDIVAIAKAHEHGIGEIDLSKVTIKEIEL